MLIERYVRVNDTLDGLQVNTGGGFAMGVGGDGGGGTR